MKKSWAQSSFLPDRVPGSIRGSSGLLGRSRPWGGTGTGALPKPPVESVRDQKGAGTHNSVNRQFREPQAQPPSSHPASQNIWN